MTVQDARLAGTSNKYSSIGNLACSFVLMGLVGLWLLDRCAFIELDGGRAFQRPSNSCEAHVDERSYLGSRWNDCRWIRRRRFGFPELSLLLFLASGRLYMLQPVVPNWCKQTANVLSASCTHVNAQPHLQRADRSRHQHMSLGQEHDSTRMSTSPSQTSLDLRAEKLQDCILVFLCNLGPTIRELLVIKNEERRWRMAKQTMRRRNRECQAGIPASSSP